MMLLGVDFLNSHGIIHRDLKPENIFINEMADGKKILSVGDFGISKYDLDTMKQTQSENGFNTTPLYKAPEVIYMQEATHKVDIWALGVTLYQLLSSRHPFKKRDFVQTLICIKEYQQDPLPAHISDGTKRLVDLLL